MTRGGYNVLSAPVSLCISRKKNRKGLCDFVAYCVCSLQYVVKEGSVAEGVGSSVYWSVLSYSLMQYSFLPFLCLPACVFRHLIIYV